MKLPASESDPEGDAEIRDVAARWIVRQDRGLSDEEAADLAAWLAADPRHAAAWRRSGAAWRTFGEIAASVRRAPKRAPAARRPLTWLVVGTLAAAAALVLAFLTVERAPPRSSAASTQATDWPAGPTTRQLADGSVARLKADAEIRVAFSAAERRVRLVRGEVFLTVAKDPSRPFFVEARNVTVRAVGTAFAVRFDLQAVDVLVTEGTVQVTPAASGPSPAQPEPTFVNAGHRAVVARVSEPQASPVVVTAVSTAEITRALAWSEPLLELVNGTVGELVSQLAQRSGRAIEIGDPALAATRIGGRFPIDDVDGFIRALGQVYDVKAERRADGVVVLRKAP